MTDFCKEHAQILLIILVGSVATAVKMINDTALKGRTLWDKTMIFFTGSITSGFLCWMSFELVEYYAKNEHLALAVGGFVAWKGGEWATRIIVRFINIKILGCDENCEKEFKE